MPPRKRVRIALPGEPSMPVRVVTHGPSDPVELVTSKPSDPIRIVTEGASDPVRGVVLTPPGPPPQSPPITFTDDMPLDNFLDAGSDPDHCYGADNTIQTVVGGGVCYCTSVLKFNLPVLGNKTVVSGKLHLRELGWSSGDRHIQVHRILPVNSGWTELDSCWNYANKSTSLRWAGDVGANGGMDAGCSVAPVDFASAVMGAFVANGSNGYLFEYVIDLDPVEVALMMADNHGLVLYPVTDDGMQFFVAHNYSSNHPLIEVVYTVPL